MKQYAYIAAVALVAVAGVGLLAKAVNDQVNITVNDGGVGIMNGAAPAEEMGEQELGITSRSDLVTTGDLTVGDDATVGDVLSIGGVEEDWIEGTCTDATTTLFKVANPWGADAFIDRIIFEVTGATSTFEVTIGSTTLAASGNTLSADPDDNLVDDLTVATSTAYKSMNTSGTLTAAQGWFTDPGTNSQDVIVWESAQYIAGFAQHKGYINGIVNAANTFVCTYKIHSFR